MTPTDPAQAVAASARNPGPPSFGLNEDVGIACQLPTSIQQTSVDVPRLQWTSHSACGLREPSCLQ
jgi:hypothetical protein